MSENVSRVQRDDKVPMVNLPNTLTVLRLVLVPVLVAPGLQSAPWTALWVAFVVFVVVAITDRFDEKLARSQGQITDFGRIADPIADEALALCGSALLSYQGYLPWWVAILIAVRESGIIAMCVFFLRRGVVVSVNQADKLETFMQMVALGTLLIPQAHFKHINDGNERRVVLLIRLGQIFAGVAFAPTLYSGFMYVIDGTRLTRGASADEAVGDSHDNDAPEEPAPSHRGTTSQHFQS